MWGIDLRYRCNGAFKALVATTTPAFHLRMAEAVCKVTKCFPLGLELPSWWYPGPLSAWMVWEISAALGVARLQAGGGKMQSGFFHILCIFRMVSSFGGFSQSSKRRLSRRSLDHGFGGPVYLDAFQNHVKLGGT